MKTIRILMIVFYGKLIAELIVFIHSFIKLSIPYVWAVYENKVHIQGRFQSGLTNFF